MNKDSISTIYVPDLVSARKELAKKTKEREDLLTEAQLKVDADGLYDGEENKDELWFKGGMAVYNQKINDPKGSFRLGESPSFTCHASAEGLAKLGGFMANRGTFQGHQLISEATWDQYHSEVNTKMEASLAMRWTFCKGGSGVLGKDAVKDCPWDDRIQTKGFSDRSETLFDKNCNGWFGWGGFGGSAFRYNPEMKMSIGYTCSNLIVCDIVNTKMSNFQKIAVDITNEIM